MRVHAQNDKLLFSLLFALLAILAIHLFAALSHGAQREEVRIRAGLDLFPSLLAADLNIEDKKGQDGKLLLVLVYADNPGKAKAFASHLASVERIRGLPIQVVVADNRSMDKFEDQTIAGIFLTQPMSHTLDSIITLARMHQCILFSPFDGDVERGVTGGMHISDRVLPFLNVSALDASNIRIKPFFLRVSMRHGEK